jgi:hypothetical protein
MMTTTTAFLNPKILTNVTIPNEITGYPSIDWTTSNNTITENNYAISSKPLHTISGLWMEKFLSNTSELYCTGYNFSNTGNTVVSVELALNIQRASRIQDLKIKLILNGVEIANSNNLASTINPVQSNMYTGDSPNAIVPIPLGNYNIYGGSLSTWGVSLTSAQVADPTFGVVISFHSNQIYPHTDLVYLSQAALRVTYA